VFVGVSCRLLKLLITSTDGNPMKEPPHPILAQGKVRSVGDHVAMVVAETLDQAKNAAELVEVDYDVLSAVVRVTDAAKATALTDRNSNRMSPSVALQTVLKKGVFLR